MVGDTLIQEPNINLQNRFFLLKVLDFCKFSVAVEFLSFREIRNSRKVFLPSQNEE